MGTEQIWQREYEATRYLRKMEDGRLQRRFDHLVSNLWTADEEGKVAIIRNQDRRTKLLELLCHVAVEQMHRTKTPSRSLDVNALVAASAAGFSPPKLKAPFAYPPNCLTKFGKTEHIKGAYEYGRLRIAPASSYNDPSLNPAQTDDELQHSTVTPNERLIFELRGLDADGREVNIPAEPLELHRMKTVADFYVWCCGLGYDARLFHEFEADAALVIHNIDAFVQRLALAVAKVFRGDMLHGPLGYYDSYTSRPEQVRPIFGKRFEFAWQNEYRFAWQIPEGSAVAPFFVELGLLSSISKLIQLA